MIKGNIEDLRELLNKSKSIIVYGITGSGKTALVYKILSLINEKSIYFIGHPKPNLIKSFGYDEIADLSDIDNNNIENSVIYIDEPQLVLDSSDNKRDSILAKLLSLARQKDNIFIISTSDTRLLSPKVESYFELWFIKNCDYSMTKQRSKVRKIIKKNCLLPEGFYANINEFLFESPQKIFNGRYNFTLIPEWTEKLSKPFKNIQITLQELTPDIRSTGVQDIRLRNQQNTESELLKLKRQRNHKTQS